MSALSFGPVNAVSIPWAPPPTRERARILTLLGRKPREAARGLLGHVLVRWRGSRLVAARIVETEAYLGVSDPFAHASHGRTRRTEPLWGPPGTVYVYLIYGMYHCLNLAVQESETPGCVLIRAAEPLPETGLDERACRGPGRLCRALGLTVRESGAGLFAQGSRLWLREGRRPRRIGTSARVGFDDTAYQQLRFFDAESQAVSTFRAGRSRSRAPRSSHLG